MSGSKPKHDIMTPSQMDEYNIDKVASSRLYARDVDSGEKVSALVHLAAEGMVNLPEKINLFDVAQVKSVTLEYLRSCERTGAMPSKIGACRSMGITRQAVDRYILQHPDSASAQYLQLLFDACSECLMNGALVNGVQQIPAIFVAKAIYGYREALEIVTPQNTPLGEALDEAELKRRIASDVIIDDDFSDNLH